MGLKSGVWIPANIADFMTHDALRIFTHGGAHRSKSVGRIKNQYSFHDNFGYISFLCCITHEWKRIGYVIPYSFIHMTDFQWICYLRPVNRFSLRSKRNVNVM